MISDTVIRLIQNNSYIKKERDILYLCLCLYLYLFYRAYIIPVSGVSRIKHEINVYSIRIYVIEM